MRAIATLAVALAAAIVWTVGSTSAYTVDSANAYVVDPFNRVMEVVKAANVRAGPSTEYDVRVVLHEGATVRVTGAVLGRDWMRVDLRGDGDESFIYAPLLRETGVAAGLRPVGPNWSVTQNQPCHVWNDGQRGQEPFIWWGDCVDGKASGEGRLIWHTRYGRHVYEGNMVAGKQHGHGTLLRSDAARYEGEWQEGKRHGIGIYTWAAGHRYEGGWRDDRPHGFGTATFADGDVHQGEWRRGCYGERDGIWSALIATVEDCGFN